MFDGELSIDGDQQVSDILKMFRITYLREIIPAYYANTLNLNTYYILDEVIK